MSDIVERLKQGIRFKQSAIPVNPLPNTGYAEPDLHATMTLLIEAAAEITRLRAELAEARDKALDEAAGELERLDGFGEWHEAAQAIRALKSPKPPIY